MLVQDHLDSQVNGTYFQLFFPQTSIGCSQGNKEQKGRLDSAGMKETIRSAERSASPHTSTNPSLTAKQNKKSQNTGFTFPSVQNENCLIPRVQAKISATRRGAEVKTLCPRGKVGSLAEFRILHQC